MQGKLYYVLMNSVFIRHDPPFFFHCLGLLMECHFFLQIYLKETLNSVVVTDDHITKGSLKVRNWQRSTIKFIFQNDFH